MKHVNSPSMFSTNVLSISISFVTRVVQVIAASVRWPKLQNICSSAFHLFFKIMNQSAVRILVEEVTTPMADIELHETWATNIIERPPIGRAMFNCEILSRINWIWYHIHLGIQKIHSIGKAVSLCLHGWISLLHTRNPQAKKLSNLHCSHCQYCCSLCSISLCWP